MGTRGIIAAVAAGMAVLSGCGSQDARTMEPEHGPDVSILGASGQTNYNVAESPAELIEEREPDVIVSGAVEEIEQGRDLYGPGDSDPLPYLVMPIRVSDTLLGSESEVIHDGRVFVELFQGATYTDSGEPEYPLSEWREAIPEGTEVMVFLYDFDHAERNDYRTEHEDRGLPEGAAWSVTDPQGLIFEYDDEIVADDGGGIDPVEPWDMDSIDEIKAAVERHLEDGN